MLHDLGNNTQMQLNENQTNDNTLMIMTKKTQRLLGWTVQKLNKGTA